MKSSSLAAAMVVSAACGCPQESIPPPSPECAAKVKLYYYPEDSAKIFGPCGMLDEPYWNACGTPGTCAFDAPLPPVWLDVPGVTAKVDDYIANCHTPAVWYPSCASWVNFSYPEMNWVDNGGIPWPKSGRVGMDRYSDACHLSNLHLTLDQLVKHHLPWQKMTAWVKRDPDVLSFAIRYACEHGIDTVIAGDPTWHSN